MTTRSRFSLKPILIFAAFAFVSWLPVLASMHLEAATPQRVAMVTVHPGDTVWSIAEARANGQEPGEIVDRIIDANHLKNAELTPGQRLRIPQ